MNIENKIKVPFSYFGSKSKISNIVWSRFGQVSNYVEPFAGSLAILFANPLIPKIETVNDLDCGLINFWRSITFDVANVIKFADFPVSEAELHARHRCYLQN